MAVSWQAAKYATPELIEAWMELAAASYAKATEKAAGAALVAGVTATGSVASDDLAGWTEAIRIEIAQIQLAGEYLCDVIYADPLSAAHLLSLVQVQLPNTTSIGGLEVISSAGLASGPTVIVGYSQALLCAETPDAPIQLRAVEPAIGGVEVGVIGGFAAVVADAAAFVRLTS